MKKHLLLVVMSIAMMQLVSAQVIEVVGKGVINDDNPTLTIPNMETVDKVVVEAAAEFMNIYGVLPYLDPENVTFSSGTKSIVAGFNNIDINKSPYVADGQYWKLWTVLVASFGYYTATFDQADISGGEISLDKNLQGKSILTFYAYIYRTDGTVNKYSLMSEKRAFLWLNGIEDPMEYEFDLPAAQSERDVKVTIPFSDNFETGTDSRIAVLYLLQGGEQVLSETFNINASGTNFLAKTVELGNVPGDVTKIIVAIYSPETVYSEPNVIDFIKTGDSFLLGLPVLTVENVDPGCTRTIGYWKTHSIYGPAKKADATWNLILPSGPDAPFFLSEQTYIKVLNTSPRGNPYYILAHQYIAAKLNFLAGAYGGAVNTEFAAATALLQTYKPAQVAAMANNNAIKKSFTTLGGILDKYNNGIIGPGHCDELQEKSASIGDENGFVQPSEFAVYPNPVTNNAIVSFNAANDGLATVELYNSVGQKVGRILQQNVLKGVQVKAAFSGLELNEGLYILVLQNGNYRETAKIRISR